MLPLNWDVSLGSFQTFLFSGQLQIPWGWREECVFGQRQLLPCPAVRRWQHQVTGMPQRCWMSCTWRCQENGRWWESLVRIICLSLLSFEAQTLCMPCCWVVTSVANFPYSYFRNQGETQQKILCLSYFWLLRQRSISQFFIATIYDDLTSHLFFRTEEKGISESQPQVSGNANSGFILVLYLARLN